VPEVRYVQAWILSRRQLRVRVAVWPPWHREPEHRHHTARPGAD